MTVYPLAGVVRPYAWGSRTVLAELQGRPVPAEGPEAELWLGAHPGDPSTVTGPDGGPVSLATLIEDDPKARLGPEVADEFGARLPYLMKVLAADAPLSLQAHPDAEYARQAYAVQEADPGAPRNYTDPHHKPEMLVALTRFEALCGFRAPEVSAAVLEGLGLPALEAVIAALRTGVPGLREAVETLLSWPAGERAELIESVAAAARAAYSSATASASSPASSPASSLVSPVASPSASSSASSSASPLASPFGSPSASPFGSPSASSFARSYALAADLAERYPGDPGVLVALLLNQVSLAPGEAIWMPAGNLHAYLEGAGVEIMASSDNVLRGGLTPKRVDVPELMRVLRFEVLSDPVLRAREVAQGVVTWPVPVREFALYRVELAGTRPPTPVPAAGPRIILGTRGDVFVGEEHGTPVEVAPGFAAFAPADAGPITLAGVGEAFIAAVPS